MSNRFEAFLGLSGELTAFSHFDLLGTGLADRYLVTLDKVVGGEIVDALLAAFAALPPRKVRSASRRCARPFWAMNCSETWPVR